MEKEIDWYGALGMTAIFLAAGNITFFIIFYLIDGWILGVDVHIVLSIVITISGVVRGNIIPYKGFLDKEEDNDDDYYKPPQIFEYVWNALVVIFAIYVFFIM